MSSEVFDFNSVVQPDRMAVQISERYISYDMARQLKKYDWEEVRRYVYATDTTQTTNSKLPWKNKTTIPKLCQIRDNLYSNYTATLFPRSKWLDWEASEKNSESVMKRDAIINYMSWVITQPSFKHEIDKVILDYIDFGNCFVTVDWVDQRKVDDNRVQAGYVGPVVKRISPLDIVFNPTSSSFETSPKIVRSLISLGDLKKLLSKLSTDDNREEYNKLWDYLKNLREFSRNFTGDFQQLDNIYQVDGFTSFKEYLESDTAEVLTFYGDIYDVDEDVFYENYVITVVDRHKLIGRRPNPSFFGTPPIFHAPWRKRQDNLWGMGPLDNLVGLQYRMDHIENMKADILDFTLFPVKKVKGYVEDFDWKPGANIYVSEESDVEVISPDVQALQVNIEIGNIERLMEEMAGAPKEAMGFRTPGEKTKYEVQRLENAASRIFQNKIKQFEEQIIEPVLNAMLELARRNMTEALTIRVFDDELKIATFQTLTAEDITGYGRIKPIAARHFAEQADLVQNMTSLAMSNIWPIVQPHFSSIEMARIIENIFNLKDFGVVRPFVALAEQADAQRYVNAIQEVVASEATTATGLDEDYDLDAAFAAQPQIPTEIPQEV